MKILFLILMASLTISAQNLDSILNSGAQQVRQLKLRPLTPPDKLFANRSPVGTPTVTNPVLQPLNSIHDPYSMELEKRVRELEINITKVTIILENIQKVNQKHTNNFSTVMHFLEVIITAMAAIATAMIGVYVKGRKK